MTLVLWSEKSCFHSFPYEILWKLLPTSLTSWRRTRCVTPKRWSPLTERYVVKIHRTTMWSFVQQFRNKPLPLPHLLAQSSSPNAEFNKYLTTDVHRLEHGKVSRSFNWTGSLSSNTKTIEYHQILQISDLWLVP